MTTSPVLLLTVGLPRSGKSTWAMNTGLPVVCPDSVRLALHGQPFYAPAEPVVWAVVRLMVSALFKAGHRCIILDATNTTQHRRNEWRSSEWRCGYVCFKTEKDVCIERARTLQQPDLIPIIERMAANLEWPDDTVTFSMTTGPSGLLHYIPEPHPLSPQTTNAVVTS